MRQLISIPPRHLIIVLSMLAVVASAASLESDLRRAAEKGRSAEVAKLLKQGAPVDSPDNDGRTPLIKAADKGHLETVRVLIAHGADVNHLDKKGFSALRLAAVSGYAEIAEALLDAGADPDRHGEERVTPLMAAAVTGRTATARLLLARGANSHLVDSLGRDALCYAAAKRYLGKRRSYLPRHPELIRSILDAGADPSASKCFVHPDYAAIGAKAIALIRLEDNREEKGDAAKLLQKIEEGLNKLVVRKKYGGLGLGEVRQRLLAAGFSKEEIQAPDPTAACKALPVDSVFEFELKDYSKYQHVIERGSKMTFFFRLTSCRNGIILYQEDVSAREDWGPLVTIFLDGTKFMIDAYIALPPPDAVQPRSKTKEESGQTQPAKPEGDKGVLGRFKGLTGVMRRDNP